MEISTYPSTAFDWFNYVAQDYNSNALIQFVLKFDQSIHFETLQRAVSSCLTEDPLLGCIFTPKSDMPKWVSTTPNLSNICRCIEVEDISTEINAFLSEKIDASKELPIKVALITDQNENTLVIKVHHALCDAGGALQFVRLLAATYTKIENDADFAPIKGTPKRGWEDFYDYFEVKDKEARLNPSILSNIPSSWGTPSGNTEIPQTFAYQLLRLEKADLMRIKQYAKTHHSSLNAVITAAYYQALIKLLKPSESSKELQFSANLRPYTKNEPNTICNHSNMYNALLPVTEDFAALAQSAKKAIDEVLEPEKVLQSVLACEMMSTSYDALNAFYAEDWENVKQSGLCTPMISNIGRLDNKAIYFGAQLPADMYLVSPAFIGPSFMLAISTYNDVITCCSAYQKPSTEDAFVTTLLSTIQDLIKKIS